ncbi:MAG: NeuD/PglB/VioB family sugar acetyltransferase, partial [Intrasporangium sp.]|uniref:NeuD/PglB/VioB family sugar acetyltransferase n=1 Tax=Intrasporangium sp. TaxID=1925024 RepID=UPI0026490DBD
MAGQGAPLLLLAASGLAREVAAAARAAGIEVTGCLDDSAALAGQEVAPGLRVLGSLDDLGRYPDAGLVVCAGKGTVRDRIVERLARLGVDERRYASIVDPRAMLAPDTIIGHGSIVLAGVVATTQVVIGEHVVAMPNVVLTHDNRIEPYATLCAGVVLGGSVVVGRGAYVGMAASVREGLTLGAGSLIGMGSVVLRDVGPGETWVGVPARP